MADNRIKKAREAAGLSQGDLAKSLGVTRQTISSYERGQREPRMETWEALSKKLLVSVPYLQGVSDDNLGVSDLLKNSLSTVEYRKMLDKYKNRDKTPEQTDDLLSAFNKMVNTKRQLGQVKIRAMNQLLDTLDALDVSTLDIPELIGLNDVIHLCLEVFDRFGHDATIEPLFGSLAKGWRSLVKNDNKVEQREHDFLDVYNQLLQAVLNSNKEN